MTAYDDATTVTPAGDGAFRATVAPDWSVGGIPNGGYLLALMLRAALHETGPLATHPHPVAISAHFLSATTPGPATASVVALRSGRTTGTAQVTLAQDGVVRVAALVTAAQLTDAEPDWEDGRQPDVAPIERCVPGAVDLPDGSRIGLLEPVDIRVDPDHVGWLDGRPGDALSMRGHVRLRDGDQPDPLRLVLFVDCFPPTVYHLAGSGGWSPTVELSVLIRGLPSPGWVTADLRGRLVRDGWFDEETDLYDARGRLVAQARQLARVSLKHRVGAGTT